MIARQGYNFHVDDDLHVIRMEDSADVGVELVKLVYGFPAVHVPQHTVVEHKVVCLVEGRAVTCVVVGFVLVIQSHYGLSCCYVVDLRAHAQDKRLVLLAITFYGSIEQVPHINL